MLWFWIYLAVAASIAGGGLWVTRDMLTIGGADALVAGIALTLLLAFAWLPFLLGALGGFFVFVTNPSVLRVFRNQAGG